ncbi:putative integral membrane family protein [Zalerion maritima]|uniref:Integral membrane family protein n=1 Tax=Zalerion maritima TaxID=339359 RepID=A0AAD5WV31_9PEZI|nr:putative integral membrane family protein [Zalerion maritima]
MGDEVDLNETNGKALVSASVVFLVISYLSVFLRSYVRAFLTNGFQADDWFMVVAQINYTLSCAFVLAGVSTGLGHHNAALPQDEEIEALKWQALATATYVSNMMFIKLSIGFFLLRLATERRYKYTIWGSLVVITIMSTVLFFWNIFQCSPLQAQWDYTIENHKCVTTEQVVAAAYALSILTILTDWLYALLPIPMIWKVKMSIQAKMTVSVVLGLGVFASVATLIRLKFLADLNDADDILFGGTDAMVWTLVEPGVAISAASLVTIRPLLRAWRLKGFESTDRYGSRRYGMPSGGNGSVMNSRQGKSRGMPGFGSGEYANGDVELGNKGSFSTTTIITGGSAASGSSGGFSYNTTPPVDVIRNPGKVRPLSRISEGTMGTESRRSGQKQYVESPSNNSPTGTKNPFHSFGPLPSGPLSSNSGLSPGFNTALPPRAPPPQGALPKPPAFNAHELAPPSPIADPRRSTVKSEVYVIEGERVQNMSRDDMAWVARHQHPGWEDRHVEETSERADTPSTASIDTVGWMETQGQRVGGGSMSSPMERSGVRVRDGAYGPL